MRILTIALLLCLPLSGVAQNAPPKALSFTDISGVLTVIPLAVSKAGIVGYMCCQSDAADDESIVGFIQNRSLNAFPNFALLGQPLAGSSFATGVSSSGTVVGSFCAEGAGCGEGTFGQHGFSTDITGFVLSPIDFPGAISTIGGGINSQGVIVGSYCTQVNTCATFESQHGFKYQGGAFTTVDFPGAEFTSINAINDNGDMVGVYGTQKAHGFLLHNGVFTSLDVPNAGRLENFESINSAGVIVGTYTDAQNKSHGFEYINGVYTNIDYPNATGTTADGIDDQGEIIGSFSMGSNHLHGYQAK